LMVANIFQKKKSALRCVRESNSHHLRINMQLHH
jgi:hypothetical protein